MLLGIDMGTSAVKAVVIDASAELRGIGMREIPMLTAAPGRAEQDPLQWWAATVEAVRDALAAAGATEVTAIGIDAHMHGVTLLDADQQLVGNSITWADQRSAALVGELEATVGTDTFLRIAGTRPAAGFMGPTLAWLARNDTARLDRAAVSILPKDYLRLRMTGEVASDVSDASATALFDIGARTWSSELAARMGIPERLFPRLHESADVAGNLRADAAAELGLPVGVPVVAGAADMAALAVANGLLEPGDGGIALGSGGQLFIAADRPAVDPHGRISTFNHAVPGRWYQLGATLSGGLSLRWLRDLLGLDGFDAYAELDAMAARIPPGADGLTFLPYLHGERSPLMDPNVRGGFIGLTMSHGRGHLARAVLEGVACSLRAGRDAVADVGVAPSSWLASGNGLASPLWRSIVADVFGKPLRFVTARERPAVGAALIAGIGTGVYASYREAAQAAARPTETAAPDPGRAATYDAVFEAFQRRTATAQADQT